MGKARLRDNSNPTGTPPDGIANINVSERSLKLSIIDAKY
jgi:hypothetical protein